MFTGIVQAVGVVESVDVIEVPGGSGASGADATLAIRPGKRALDTVRPGDSVCVSGVCLTATEVAGGAFRADVSAETLARTTLGALESGSRVNLEAALTPATPLGGHLVTGHVDGTGTVQARHEAARSVGFRIGLPRALARYVAAKGSICVDGVSLTVNAVTARAATEPAGADAFEVNIVPHTLRETTLADWQPDARVNLEVDIVARYLERLLGARDEAHGGGRAG